MRDRKVAAIVQARMSSSRFARKVLRPLAGMPLLWHVLERLKRCRRIDAICVATTDSYEDDYLARVVSSWGYEVIRGPQDDVLARYVMAAKALEADYVVRVTSDAPLICPETIDALAELIVESDADYATGHERSVHEGFELISTPLLLWLDKNVREASHREHVTTFVREHPELFNVAYLQIPSRYLRSDLRLSIDTYSDWELFDAIYRRLWRPGGIVDLDEAIDLIDSDPSLKRLNFHIEQKPYHHKPLNIAFRIDAGPTVGLGHLYRSYAIARRMNEVHHSPVWFLVKGASGLFSTLRRKGYRTIQLPARYNDADEAKEIARFLKSHDIDMLLVDVKHPYPASALKVLKRTGARIVAIDPPIDMAPIFDAAIFPDAAALFEVPDHDTYLRGPKFFPLRLEMKRERARRRQKRRGTSILVFAGGGDEKELTPVFLDALATLPHEMEVLIMLSSANPRRDQVISSLDNYPHTVHVFSDLDDPAPVFARTDIALTTYGAVVYELAYFGVSILTVSHSPRNARSESLAARFGFFEPLGYWCELEKDEIASAVERLLTNRHRVQALSRRALRMVDGKGTERIACALKAVGEKSHEQDRSLEVVSLSAVQ